MSRVTGTGEGKKLGTEFMNLTPQLRNKVIKSYVYHLITGSTTLHK
jgi:hypothetical protein